ncbi:MAG: Ig-like domain-containing protein [Eubacterium sp.]|nr:Ig-like domain-containing protein [Eubacterium sp.]
MKMKRRNAKRIIAIMLSFAMVVPFVCANIQEVKADTTQVPSWLTTQAADEDIVVTVTNNATYSGSAITSALGAQAESAGNSTSIKNTAINVADLSNWYVYDRYDTNVYANSAEYLEQTGYNESLRPYFGDADIQALDWPTSIGTVGDDDYVDLSDTDNWTIENAKKLNSTTVLARHLKEHIAAGIDSTGAANVYWYGYSATPGTDWAFYPAAAGGSKTVDYKVDASKIYFHTVSNTAGTGFLINSKIEDGKLSGYAVMTNYTADTTNTQYPSGIAGFTIYKYEDVDVTTVHNSILTTVASSYMTSSADFSECTNANGYDETQVHMDITDTHLTMTITPIGDAAAENASAITVFDCDLDDLSAGGFGPVVSYLSHACNLTSSVDFTDLKMSLSDSSSVLSNFANADYIQFDEQGNASRKYYVLLGNNTNTEEEGYVDFFDLTGDAAFLELLKKEKVVLITNLEISTVTIDEGKNGTRCNLEDYLGAGNVVKLELESDATDEEIAQAIYQKVTDYTYDEESAASASNALDNQTTTTAANVYVTEQSCGAQVESINMGDTTFTGANLLVNTELSTDNIENLVVTVLDPNGNALEAPDETNTDQATYDAENQIIYLPPTAVAGTYTVTASDTLSETVTQTMSAVTYFSVTKNMGVTFNGGTDQSGTEIDRCSTTNTLGDGVIDTLAGDYQFVINLDEGMSELYTLELTWGSTGTENELTDSGENPDYTVVQNGTTYTITIPADVIATLQGTLNVKATCGNVIDKMDNVEIEDAEGLGTGSIVNTCTSDEDFFAYLNVDTAHFENITSDQLTIYSDDKELVYQSDYDYDVETGLVRIFGDRIGETLTFEGEPTACSLSVTFEGELCLTFQGESTADFTTEYTATIVPDRHYYVKNLEITSDCDGHETLVSPDDYTFDGTTITIKKNHVWGNLVIEATADTKYYYVSNTIENLTAEVDGTQVTDAQPVKYSTVYRETLVAADGYYLPDTISVTRGEETLVEEEDYRYNSKTGKVMIRAEAITGNIVIGAKGAQILNVTKQLTGLTLDGEDTVGYKNQYKGTFRVQDSSYRMPDSIQVMAGNELLEAGTDYAYNSESGELIVYSAAVTDNLTITAYGDNSNIVDALEHAKVMTKDNEEARRFEEGTTTYLYLVADEGYELPTQDELRIYYDSRQLTYKAKEYSYEPNTGKVSIWRSVLEDDTKMLTFTLEEEAVEYSVTKTGTNVTISGGDVAYSDTDYQATITAGEHYDLPHDITVKAGEDVLTATTDYTYDKGTGEILIYAEKITGDLTIEATGVCDRYSVTKKGTNEIISGDDQASHGEDYVATVTANEKYDLPETVSVKVGDETLTQGTDFEYDPETGQIKIPAAQVTGNVEIMVAGVPAQYTVTKNGNYATLTGDDTAVYGEEYCLTVEAVTNYKLPQNITVTVDSQTQTVGVDYTYNVKTGEITIDADKITGNIEITVNASEDELAAAKAAFEKYKEKKMKEAGQKASSSDSSTVKKLIKEAQTKIKNLTYDEDLTLAANKARVDAILASLTSSVTTQKVTESAAKNKKSSEFKLNAGLKVSQSGSQIKVKWGKVSSADGYRVYVAYCGSKFKGVTQYVSKNSQTVTIKKLSGKKLKLKKNFKVYVDAYRTVNGKKISLGKTITAHVVGHKNVKYTNAKKIKLKKSTYTLKVGKKAKIKAKTVLVNKKKRQLTNAHAKEFRYASTNIKVATVSKKGTIKAKKKGTCSIYVYARNGYAKKVKVKVK